MTVHRDAVSLEAHSRDFGGIARGSCRGVAYPRDVDEVAGFLAWAQRTGTRLTVRGGGLGQSGQSIPVDGVTLCTHRLDAIGPLDLEKRRIRCGAGVSFRQVLDRTLAHGLAPRAMPLNLDLTLGGVVSAGGIGSTSHRFGPVVANVAEITLVTGDGRVHRCERFDEDTPEAACLAGLGRYGVICEVTLELRAAAPRVRTCYLRYSDAGTFLEDQRRLAALDGGRRCDHLEGFCVGGVFGLVRGGGEGPRRPLLDYGFGAQVSVEYESVAPDPDEILEGLRHDRVLLTEDSELGDYCARYDARFAMMRASGAWQQLHPWFECFLPVDAMATFLERALPRIPAFFGDGHRVLMIDARGCPPWLPLPHEEQVAAFAMLPMGIPAGQREAALEALSRLDGICRELGGQRYLSGWLGGLDARARHGDMLPCRLHARATCDPDRVFDSLVPLE